MNDESSLWWYYTSGPSRFFSDVRDSVVNGARAVAIVYGKDAGYMDELRDGVVNHYMQTGKEDYVPCDVSEADEKGVDEYIVAQVAPDERIKKRNNESAAQFILRTHCLDNKMLWLYGVRDNETGKKICAFLKEFGDKCGSSSGKVIAEGALTVSGKSVKSFYLDEYLDEVDVESFSLNLYRKKNPKESYIIYKYVSELASAAYKKSADRAENFINATEDFLSADPIEIFTREIGDGEHSKRIVHKAQQRIFNPLLEEFRLVLAEKYEKYFNEAITSTRIRVDYPKDEIKNAYDLQIGHMNYIAKKNLTLSTKIAEDDVDIIENVLYDARNKLAHIVPLKPQEVKRLCELVKYFSK